MEVLNTQKREEIETNRKRLCLIAETIQMCGRQGIALRGDEDSGKFTFAEPVKNDGNLRTLLRYRMKNDPVMKDIFERSAGNAQYCSPSIQNELIDICGQLITKKIVDQVKSADFFYHSCRRDNRYIKAGTNDSRASICGQ